MKYHATANIKSVASPMIIYTSFLALNMPKPKFKTGMLAITETVRTKSLQNISFLLFLKFLAPRTIDFTDVPPGISEPTAGTGTAHISSISIKISQVFRMYTGYHIVVA